MNGKPDEYDGLRMLLYPSLIALALLCPTIVSPSVSVRHLESVRLSVELPQEVGLELGCHSASVAVNDAAVDPYVLLAGTKTVDRSFGEWRAQQDVQ